MNESPVQHSEPSDHAWIHENLAAYLADGLNAEERQRFDQHINVCPECFDAFTEARDADRAMMRALGGLAPDATFEDQVITYVRENTMKRLVHPMLRRAGYAAAACVALAATGVFANYVLHTESRFNNPFSKQLVANADTAAPQLNDRIEDATKFLAERMAHNSMAAPAVSASSEDEAGQDVSKLALSSISARAPGTFLPGVDLTKTARFAYVDAPVDKVLTELSNKFGFTIINAGSLPTQHVTVQTLKQVNAEEALKMFNEMLVPMGYTTLVTNTLPDPSTNSPGNTILRVVSITEAKNNSETMGRHFAYATTAPAAVSSPQAETFERSAVDALDLRQSALAVRADTSDKLIASTDVGPGIVAGADHSYESIMRRAGKEDMRQNIDSAEHQIPAQGIGNNALAYNEASKSEEGKGLNRNAALDVDALARNAQALSINLSLNKSTSGQLTGDKEQPVNNWDYNLAAGGQRNAQQGEGQQPGQPAAEKYGITTPGDIRTLGDVNGPITYNGGTLIQGGAGKVTQSGPVALTKAGSGSLTMNDNNGAVVDQWKFVPNSAATVNAGTLQNTNGATASIPPNADAGANGLKLAPQAASNAGKDDKSEVRSRDEVKNAVAQDARTAMDQARQFQQIAESGDAKKPVFTVGGAAANNWSDGGKLGTFAAATPGTTDVPGSQQPGSSPRAAAAAPATTAPAKSTSPPEIAAGLKIIRNGTLEFEVRSFDDTYTLIKARAFEAGGFVSSTNSDKLANGKVRGTIIVRVPPATLDDFLSRIRALGDLKAQQISANDVTKQYTDTESELRGLHTMESRLIDLIKNGKGEVKDLVEAERQLGEYRIRIEKLEGELRYYDNLVSLCTISITAYEKDIQTPTAASEQEIVAVNVETEEVEAKYQAARKVFEDAKARIVESQLKNTDAEHVAAHIVADVPPDQADFVSGQLKQLGKVASFNRDRRQITTGGAGTPEPGVQVEHKDTRITIDLFNLANMQPRETTVLRVAVRDVESAYKDVLARVHKDADAAAPAAVPAAAGGDTAAHAVGRVISSNLNGQQPEQMSADLHAEVRSENADTLVATLRDSGEVLASSLVVNQDNAGTTSAKRGIQLTLVNIAAVPPKQINTVVIAVNNVEAAYNDLRTAIGRAAPAATQAGAPASLLPPAIGRVLNSNLSGQRPEEMSGDIRAEIRADQADEVLRLAKAAGETLSSGTNESPENAIATAVKRGLVVRYISVANVNAREAQDIHAVAQDVTAAYNALLASLQKLANQTAADNTPGGSVHVVYSGLSGTDRRSLTARFTFDAPRSADAAITKAFADAGIDFLSRNIARSTDTANTLDTKIRYQVDDIRAADALDPRRTYIMTEEVTDVDKTVADVHSALVDFPDAQFNISHDAKGIVTAHGIFDVPKIRSESVRRAISSAGGIEKDNQVLYNNAVPDNNFARDRIDVTFYSRAPIVNADQGLGTTLRAALSTASGVLFESLYLIIVGLVFVLPFALILWPIWKLARRKKAPVHA